MSSKILGWLVFSISLGAYIPLIIGGWQHPSETNVACFSLWIVLAAMLAYSAWAQGYEGWRINLAFFAGNIVVVALALIRHGYTFNLGPTEMILIYGLSTVIVVWWIISTKTGRWRPDILWIGGIIVDVISFYPIVKQYLRAHEAATNLCIAAWAMFGLGALINFVCVEKLFSKLGTNPATYEAVFGEKKSHAKILSTSAFSLENFTMIITTLVLMLR